jgi:PAS domain S-box-containing protein
MSVIVHGAEKPYGILGVHSLEDREFTENETDFVQAVANVVSAYLTRTETERALADSETRLRHIVSSMNAVPYRYDVDAKRYTFVGPQSMRLLGFTPEEWGTVGWWTRQMHPDDRSAAVELEEMLTERGEDYVLEYRMINKEGRIVWLRDIVHIETAEDGHKMLYGMGIDITDAKERERQLSEAQKLQAIGQLTGGVAHDFNNLLAIILGTCELVAEQAGDNHELKQTIAHIAAAAERGAALTHRLLTFSRKQALRPVVIDLNELVLELESLLRRSLGENVHIRTDLDDQLGRVLADVSQLENVLVNLALNARDSMPDGGDVVIATENVRIDAAQPGMEKEMPPGYYIMMSVSDTGSGMTPDVKARAFEPFFTTKSVGKGSGLGLSTVYGFVKQSGGNVTIESEMGAGTTVRIYLPRVESDEAEITEEVASGTRGRNEIILVVEDDPAVRNVVANMVESLGYQVLEACDGTDALALLAAGEKVDLVLTDVVMPGPIDGWKLAETIWERWSPTRVLLMTGYSENILVRHAALNERTQVISKPYRRSELSLKIRKVLDS